MLEKHAVDVRLNTEATVGALADFDEIVIATGVVPRELALPGADHPSVLSYADAIEQPERVGKRVAVIGAGGIGFDVSELLSHEGHPTMEVAAWCDEWGVDLAVGERGGLKAPQPPRSTTGWVHRASLKQRGVETLAGCEYVRIDDAGLHIRREGQEQVVEVDTIVVCAGQESVRDLISPLAQAGSRMHVIGGADEAAELDAKRAIDQGTRLAASL